jgi:hypothetical protein
VLGLGSIIILLGVCPLLHVIPYFSKRKLCNDVLHYLAGHADAPSPADAIPSPVLPDAPRSADGWFYANQGKKAGPYPTEAMKAMARRGELLPTAMVLQEGTGQWVQARSVAAFEFPPTNLNTSSPHASAVPSQSATGSTFPPSTVPIAGPILPASLWYYAQQGRTVGPVSIEELRRLLGAGQVLPSDFVCKQGTQAWVPANDVRELRS